MPDKPLLHRNTLASVYLLFFQIQALQDRLSLWSSFRLEDVFLGSSHFQNHHCCLRCQATEVHKNSLISLLLTGSESSNQILQM